MNAHTGKTVASTTPAVDAMREAAKLPRTLMGGTAAMRKAGTEFLPLFAAETNAAFQARLKQSTLFNAHGKTVDDLTGRVFEQAIVLKDDVPTQIKGWAENIDLVGRHINVFAKDLLHDALQTGICYILADAPRQNENIRTVADANAAGIRPYLVHIKLENLLGWQTQMIDGVETLSQVRIMETVTEPDGEWHEKEIQQVRILTPGAWETHRKKQNSQDEWELHEQGTSAVNKITLVPVYAKRTGFMTGSPPLQELADLNVAHWQSSSDQRNILHVARVPILVGTGFEEKDIIEVGASSMIRTSNPNAKLEYVEHTGAAINAGQTHIDKLETQMQAMGLQLLAPRQAAQTATGELRDDAKERSTLAMIAASLQDALEDAFGYLAQYANLGTDGGSIQVNTEFASPAGGDFASLLNAVNSGQISKSTFLGECKRRGLLAEDLDIEVELNRLEAQESRRSMDLDAA